MRAAGVEFAGDCGSCGGADVCAALCGSELRASRCFGGNKWDLPSSWHHAPRGAARTRDSKLQFAGIARGSFGFHSVWQRFRRIALERVRWNILRDWAGKSSSHDNAFRFMVLPAA